MTAPIERIRFSSYSKAVSPLERSFYARFIGRLTAMRKAKGWTQEQMDDRLGVASGLIAKWETFQKLPSAFTLMCWCQALGAELTPIALEIRGDDECQKATEDLQAAVSVRQKQAP